MGTLLRPEERTAEVTYLISLANQTAQILASPKPPQIPPSHQLPHQLRTDENIIGSRAANDNTYIEKKFSIKCGEFILNVLSFFNSVSLTQENIWSVRNKYYSGGIRI